jgi:hypothetical protein
MVIRLHAGETPQLDLNDFDLLDIGALTNLIGFCAAVKAGRLTAPYSSGLIPVNLPENSHARDYLFQTGFFFFAAFAGGLGEIVARANELALQEKEINLRRRVDKKYPYMPFQLVIRAAKGRTSDADFYSACENFLVGLTSKFFTALEGHLGFSEEKAKTFWQPNKEIVENIYKHSGSWGVGAIQCFEERVLICYADIGNGIRKTLDPYEDELVKKLGEPWSDCTAIKAAFTEGITSLPGKSRGVGLHDVRTYVNECGGTIECRSGRGKVVFDSKSKPHGYEVDYIPGVQVRIELPAWTRTNL